jgi:hypothetical protein
MAEQSRASFDKAQAVWTGARRCCGEELQTNKPIKWNDSGAFELLGIQYTLHKSDRYIDNVTQKKFRIINFYSIYIRVKFNCSAE